MKRRKKKTAPPRIARPSWKSFIPMLDTYASASDTGKEEIKKTFERMASAADAYDEK